MADQFGSICFFGPDIVGQTVNGEWKWFQSAPQGWVPTTLPPAPDSQSGALHPASRAWNLAAIDGDILDFIAKFAREACRTNSKDVMDWQEDMNYIAVVAEKRPEAG